MILDMLASSIQLGLVVMIYFISGLLIAVPVILVVIATGIIVLWAAFWIGMISLFIYGSIKLWIQELKALKYGGR